MSTVKAAKHVTCKTDSARGSALQFRRQLRITPCSRTSPDLEDIKTGKHLQSDRLRQREKAIEDLYFHQKGLENLKHLRTKLAVQRDHLEEINKHIEDMLNSESANKI